MRLDCIRDADPGLTSFLGQPWAKRRNAVGVGVAIGEEATPGWIVPLDPHRMQRISILPRNTHKPQITEARMARIQPTIIRSAAAFGRRVRKTNPTTHTELTTANHRLKAMNRLKLIRRMGGFNMGDVVGAQDCSMT